MEWYYVYVLQSQIDNSWYIGYTSDLDKRLLEHNSGKTISTNRKKPWHIIYFEASKSKEDAIAREKYLSALINQEYTANATSLLWTRLQEVC